MDKQYIDEIEAFIDGDLIDIIVSNSSDSQSLKKVKIRPVMINGVQKYQVTSFQGTKVFHKNCIKEEMLILLQDYVDGYKLVTNDENEVVIKFKQIVIRSVSRQMNILVSRKGRIGIKINENKEKLVKEEMSHNRDKNYILKEGITIPFMIDLGVMTKEGKVVRTKYDKYRQINRFLEFVEDISGELPWDREIKILDFGCGKSYLTFALYYFLKEIKKYDVSIVGLDLKEDVIKTCNKLAGKYGYSKLKFLQGDIAHYHGTTEVDMVVTLHACDTATDYAIYKAIDWNAKVILAVPCCQHELNKQIFCEELKPILKYGLLKERMAALITDGLRARLLEGAGYRTQILEFIDMEHTPKNILIRAVRNEKTAGFDNKDYQNLVNFLNVVPSLGELLKQNP